MLTSLIFSEKKKKIKMLSGAVAISTLRVKKMFGCMASSADPHQIAPFDLGLFCLLRHNCTNILTLTTLWANSADDKLMICFLFFLEIGSDTSSKLSP